MSESIPGKYDPKTVEDKWYAHWMKKNYFHSEPDGREPYCIVIPPPNVTGVLHMGHMLNNTIQDVLVRRARMKGKNACWVPGTDHASIATEAKVVAKLKEKGIEKSSLSREEFLNHAWEWRAKHGGIILEQLKKLGASCDWERTAFTMDEALYESVIDVFIDLYKKGLIYRGVRMVNWDPQALTALSDEEVIFKDTPGKLYYIKYPVEGEPDKFVTIATTRPETMLGDTAVCIHPGDQRFRSISGKNVILPLINRVIPVIEDEYVDMEFGTGCLKITPAHDYNDYLIGEKYNLQVIDIFNENGTLNAHAQILVGEDRAVARKKIVRMLEDQGFLEKTEDYNHNVGYSERTDVPIEPKLSTQWFLSMRNLAEPALKVVINNTVRFHPEKFKNLYKHWMENVRDWCISRQLWWGQRIPAWYIPDGRYVVAKTAEEACGLAREKFGIPELAVRDLKQDEDVLDTWFSSWLWPISVFDGIRKPDNPDMKYYYPTDDLVTAPEILFFWVARMIMAGLEYPKKIPFKNVYFTGIVRDKLGRKMSKSLGNSPEPLELIKKYGADGVRLGMLLTSPAGNDLPFDESLCEQGRNFSNKLWNALRLVKGWEIDDNKSADAASEAACRWFEHKLNETGLLLEDHLIKYRIDDGLMLMYRVTWDDFCSWFLELVKPPFGETIDSTTYNKTIGYFETLLKLMHPYLPFITEELWHQLNTRKDGEDIIIEKIPQFGSHDQNIIDSFEVVKEVVGNIRNLRAKYGISPKTALQLQLKTEHPEQIMPFAAVISKLGHLDNLQHLNEPDKTYAQFLTGKHELYLSAESTASPEEEVAEIEKEINYYEGFLISTRAKLTNERFVSSAPPAIVEKEKQKQQDALNKLQILKERLQQLKG
jgi:valyl-tRNA synthetase